MQLGMIGLGRMGGNMVERLIRHGHQCVVYDLSPANVQSYVGKGAAKLHSLQPSARVKPTRLRRKFQIARSKKSPSFETQVNWYPLLG